LCLYFEFTQVADEEWFPETAKPGAQFEEEERRAMKQGTMLFSVILRTKRFSKKGKPVKWRCRNCGYIS
jgi:rubrerythrin